MLFSSFQTISATPGYRTLVSIQVHKIFWKTDMFEDFFINAAVPEHVSVFSAFNIEYFSFKQKGKI